MQLHKLYLHFYDQPRLWHHSETIIYPFIDEPHDAVAITHHPLTLFLKTGKLFVTQIITYRFKVFHSKWNKFVARLPLA